MQVQVLSLVRISYILKSSILLLLYQETKLSQEINNVLIHFYLQNIVWYPLARTNNKHQPCHAQQVTIDYDSEPFVVQARNLEKSICFPSLSSSILPSLPSFLTLCLLSYGILLCGLASLCSRVQVTGSISATRGAGTTGMCHQTQKFSLFGEISDWQVWFPQKL